METECLGGCSEAREHFNLDFHCCASCHADEIEHDISLCSVYTENGLYYVCCSAAQALRDKVSKE